MTDPVSPQPTPQPGAVVDVRGKLASVKPTITANMPGKATAAIHAENFGWQVQPHWSPAYRAALLRVTQAATAYADAWDHWASSKADSNATVVRARAHQALLDAVRAMEPDDAH